MHVEAMNLSGMAVREYAASLQLSPTSLRKWRDPFDDGEVEIDWRAHVHPNAHPQISTGANGSAKEGSIKTALTTALTADLSPPDRKPCRVFTEEESSRLCSKRKILTQRSRGSRETIGSSPVCCSGGHSNLGFGKVKPRS